MTRREVLRACIWGLLLIVLAALLFFGPLGDLGGPAPNCLGEPFC